MSEKHFSVSETKRSKSNLKKKSDHLTPEWVLNTIQDISFYSPTNSKNYMKLVQHKLEKNKDSFSVEESNIFELFYLKLQYYAQSFSQENEIRITEIIDSTILENNKHLTYIGKLFLCRIFINSKRTEQVETLLEKIVEEIFLLNSRRLELEFYYMKALLYYYQGKYSLASRVIFKAIALELDINDLTQFGFINYFNVIHASLYFNLGMFQESLRIANRGFKEIKKKHQNGTLYFLHLNCIALNLLHLKKYNFLEKFILSQWEKIELENNIMYKRFHRSILNKIYIQNNQFNKVLPIYPKSKNEKLTNYFLLEYQVEKFYIDFILTKKKSCYHQLKKLEEQATLYTENFKITYYKYLIHLSEYFNDFKTAHKTYASRMEIEDKVNNDKAKNLIIGFHIKYEFDNLKKQIKEIQEKAKMKHDFLLSLSHDLRSPLASIVSATSLIASDKTKPELKENYINTANKSATGLIAMIDEMLEVSSIESGAIQVNIQEIYLQDFLDFIMDSHRLMAENKNLRLELNTENLKILMIESDSKLLQRILSNLITNAIKYSKEGIININTTNTDSEIVFEIKDQGIGIEEKKINSIFELYSKTSEESIKRKDSHGIGLYIVKNLVNTLKGSVEVSSKINIGSSFKVVIPIKYTIL